MFDIGVILAEAGRTNAHFEIKSRKILHICNLSAALGDDRPTAECSIVRRLDKHGLCSLEMCEPGAAAAKFCCRL